MVIDYVQSHSVSPSSSSLRHGGGAALWLGGRSFVAAVGGMRFARAQYTREKLLFTVTLKANDALRISHKI